MKSSKHYKCGYGSNQKLSSAPGSAELGLSWSKRTANRTRPGVLIEPLLVFLVGKGGTSQKTKKKTRQSDVKSSEVAWASTWSPGGISK